ncbi:LysR family transcriptional regulator [Pectobacterium jejuense]|uniref:LysR family transcriptional regulator n=1 Tax=Pectobacterium jejuense TaxID=2974022 RepID=UPI0022804359|nr:LysR family transcriptional regulator [Pectobacterium jejuense]MCY9846494.1 LysR family transcriptional regulator [Pectobacterium jejuense]
MDYIDIKHMRVFLLLVKELNVSRVASKLDISQQAVSAYLKRLRAYFGTELFLRRNAGLEATDYALSLVPRVEKILDEVSYLRSPQEFDPNIQDFSVSIMANEYAQLTIIPSLLKTLHALAPRASIEIKDFNASHHVECLNSGDIDLVLGFSNHIDPGLIRKNILREQYCCVVRHGSAIPGKLEMNMSFSDIPAVKFAPSAGNIENLVDDFFNKAGMKNNVIATLPCYTTLSAFFTANDAIAFIPSAIGALGNYFKIDTKETMTQFDVTVAWHRKSNDNPLRIWLTNILETLD